MVKNSLFHLKIFLTLCLLSVQTTPAQAGFSIASLKDLASKNKVATVAFSAACLGLAYYLFKRYTAPSLPNTLDIQTPLLSDSPEIQEILDLATQFGYLNPKIDTKNSTVHVKTSLAPCPGIFTYTAFGPQLNKSISHEALHQYKIHLTPKLYDLECIRTIIALIATDRTLSECVYEFKVRTPESASEYARKGVAPIVLYIRSKEHAQQALDALYRLTLAIEGSDVYPRYNARVSSLIWVSQGNGDDKHCLNNWHHHPNPHISAKPIDIEHYFEAPEYIYFNRNFLSDEPKNHYLLHPTTNAPLVSSEYRAQAAPLAPVYSS